MIIGSISSISLSEVRWSCSAGVPWSSQCGSSHAEVEVVSSNPFGSVFAIYKPDFEVVRIFANLSENFSR